MRERVAVRLVLGIATFALAAVFYLAEFDDGWRHSFGTESTARPRIPGEGTCQP